MNPPPFFESVRTEALKDLEVWSNPRYGGVFRQLFRQVQSPKHVLSELLQNADDAGATSATVSLNNGVFEFTHNGQDFNEEQFASLCRFAYSSKKTIQTIGFRGIGFKSTFSLGRHVYLRTPSLSVRFDDEKFILPHWQDQIHSPELTVVSIPEVKETVLDDLWHNFARWSEEPFSLLFQKSVRELLLPETAIQWRKVAKPAPERGSWYQGANGEQLYLVLRSEPSPFPQEAALEVKDERDMEARDLDNLPPCTVDLILGAPGRVYVVLPTDVITSLPFAVNAPFIQDPGRFGIKAPSVSPTNTWLLERVGELAAESMLSWLKDAALPLEQRIQAYSLMPQRKAERDSLFDQVEAMVADAFWERLEKESFILTSSGQLVASTECIFVANQLHGIWQDEWLPSIAGYEDKLLCSSSIPKRARDILIKEAGVSNVSLLSFARLLTQTRPARPKTHHQLARLWRAIVSTLKQNSILPSAHLLPTDDDEFLVSSNALTVLPLKPKEIGVDDWAFLTEGTKALSAQWTVFLDESANEDLRTHLVDLGLSKSTSISNLIERRAKTLAIEVERGDWIRLAHICAKCEIKATSSLQFIDASGRAQRAVKLLPFGEDSAIASVLPASSLRELLLHKDYWDHFDGPISTWDEWVTSARTEFLKWVVPARISIRTDTKSSFEESLPRLRKSGNSYPFDHGNGWSNQEYFGADYRFDRDDAIDESTYITFLQLNLELLCRMPEREWKSLTEFRANQSSKSGKTTKDLTLHDRRASWLLDLINYPCLQDQDGNWRFASELYIENDNTAHLKDVEPFLALRYVCDESAPLLESIGVSKKPKDINKLKERLVALSESEFDAKEEAGRIYLQINSSLPYLKSSHNHYGFVANHLSSLKFLPIVLTENHGWKRADQVFRKPSTVDLPDVALVMRNLSSLELWQELGVKEEPEWDDVISYVCRVTTAVLSLEDRRRVEVCILTSPERVWQRGKWFNCEGRWVAVTSLRYRLTTESGIKPSDLMPQFQRCTADLSRFQCPSCQLPNIQSQCEARFEPLQAGQEQNLPTWLSLVMERLKHVLLENDDLQKRVREKASVLSKSLWVKCRKISRVQLIEGDQVFVKKGTSNVFWDEMGLRLYLTDLDEADEPEEVGKCLSEALGWKDLEKLIAYCCGRSEEQVLGYINKRIKADDASVEPEGAAEEADLESDQDSVASSEEETRERPEEAKGAFQPSRPLGQYQPRVKVQKHERGKPGRLIEDYAEIEGFEYATENAYSRASDGHALIRRKDQDFPWCLTKGRDVLMQIYPLMDRLESDGVVISYERRKLLERKPDYYALLIQDDDGDPLLLTGSELLKREQAGEITCHIAEYRLRAKRQE